MTRRDYIALSTVLRTVRQESDTTQHEVLWVVTNRIADLCEADNPRFDRDRFLKASGFETYDLHHEPR